MSLGRRKVGLDDPSRWVFNKMADVYDARPPYPARLLDVLSRLAAPPEAAAAAAAAGGRVVDLGAGIGHLAVPLAERGHQVAAIEPAGRMLERLAAVAERRRLSTLAAHHASAERVPVDDAWADAVVIADALHFMDAQLVGEEIARVLRRSGALAVVTCELGMTPFMREVIRVIEQAVPRRPRALANQLVQISSITGVELGVEHTFHDETPIDHATLDRILRSISFIGPAMNPQRAADFRARVMALSDAPVWARTFRLRWGRRRRGAGQVPRAVVPRARRGVGRRAARGLN